MTTAEFALWCAGGGLFGLGLGAFLAEPEQAVRGLWDAYVRMWRGVRHLAGGKR